MRSPMDSPRTASSTAFYPCMLPPQVAMSSSSSSSSTLAPMSTLLGQSLIPVRRSRRRKSLISSLDSPVDTAIRRPKVGRSSVLQVSIDRDTVNLTFNELTDDHCAPDKNTLNRIHPAPFRRCQRSPQYRSNPPLSRRRPSKGR